MDDKQGLYKVTDDMKNFVLRVELRSLCVTTFNKQQDSQLNQSFTVKWQEKYFSQHEENLYSNFDNCQAPLHQYYHQQILKMREEGGRSNGRLFTYTKMDNNNPVDKPRYSSFVINSSEIQTKAIAPSKTNFLFPNVFLKPSNSAQKIRRFSNTLHQAGESMYIMADLGSDSTPDEHVLCHLKITNDGGLAINPDIDQDIWYRIVNALNKVFEYRIFHVSMCSYDKQSNTKPLSICHRKLKIFEKENVFTLHIFGSIVSASNFANDNLYINIDAILPNGWSLSQDSSSRITSQICKYKNNEAFFSCPFEYNIIGINNDTWPSISIEVCSFDSWSRHRVEGYGEVTLPHNKYDTNLIHVDTWRPEVKYITGQMRRFFIGGGPEISYNMTNSNTTSKYGLSTSSSGRVHLYIYTVIQCTE